MRLNSFKVSLVVGFFLLLARLGHADSCDGTRFAAGDNPLVGSLVTYTCFSLDIHEPAQASGGETTTLDLHTLGDLPTDYFLPAGYVVLLDGGGAVSDELIFPSDTNHPGYSSQVGLYSDMGSNFPLDTTCQDPLHQPCTQILEGHSYDFNQGQLGLSGIEGLTLYGAVPGTNTVNNLYRIYSPEPVPEPGTLSLLGLGLAYAGRCLRRLKQSS